MVRPTSILMLLCGFGGLTHAGQIETVAGTGKEVDGGDSGPALRTNLGNPFGVEIGPDGALYICEVSNHRVRRLDLAKSELTTVAGTGRKGYAGDGGPATKALLNEPYEVRFDKGNKPRALGTAGQTFSFDARKGGRYTFSRAASIPCEAN